MSSLLDIESVEKYLNEVELVKLAVIKYVKRYCFYTGQPIHIRNTYKIGMIDPKYLGMMIAYDSIRDEYSVFIKKITQIDYDALIRFKCDCHGKIITIKELIEDYGDF